MKHTSLNCADSYIPITLGLEIPLIDPLEIIGYTVNNDTPTLLCVDDIIDFPDYRGWRIFCAETSGNVLRVCFYK